MRFLPTLVYFCVASILSPISFPATLQAAETNTGSIPRIEKKGNRYALMVDDAPFLMLGAQIHNSSAWPAMMPQVWPAMEYMHVNTMEAPIYWEQLEPVQGQFDFSNVDMLLAEAREHHIHLVLLWFGTWKNGSSHYMPQWMKQQSGIYPNIIGKSGREVDSPSPFCQAAMELDIKAFSRLMGHLKEADARHTVLMVQVENEPGSWGSVRDYSPDAQKYFDAPVPAELLQTLGKQAAPNANPGANWQDAFGKDADEFFHAYSIAHYIQQVAAAGKAIYPLPLYVNVALRDPLTSPRAGTYESGGATDNVIPIWKAAAPAIDVIAPDIYKVDSARVLKWMELYRRDDNPLLIPEIGSGQDYARYCYAAIANQAIGFSPFGLDYTSQGNRPPVMTQLSNLQPATQPAQNAPAFDETAMNYQALGPMQREIARLSFEGKVQAAIEPESPASPASPVMHFPAWDVTATFGAPRAGSAAAGVAGSASRPSFNPHPIGRALIAQLNDNEFIVTGFYCRLTFTPTGPDDGKPWQYLTVDEGQYDNGVFKPIRIWNGDETDYGLRFSSEPVVLHVTVMVR